MGQVDNTSNELLRRAAGVLGEGYEQFVIIARPLEAEPKKKGELDRIHVYSSDNDEMDTWALIEAGRIIVGQQAEASYREDTP